MKRQKIEANGELIINLHKDDGAFHSELLRMKIGETAEVKALDQEEDKWMKTTITYVSEGKIQAKDSTGYEWPSDTDELCEMDAWTL